MNRLKLNVNNKTYYPFSYSKDLGILGVFTRTPKAIALIYLNVKDLNFSTMSCYGSAQEYLDIMLSNQLFSTDENGDMICYRIPTAIINSGNGNKEVEYLCLGYRTEYEIVNKRDIQKFESYGDFNVNCKKPMIILKGDTLIIGNYKYKLDFSELLDVGWKVDVVDDGNYSPQDLIETELYGFDVNRLGDSFFNVSDDIIRVNFNGNAPSIKFNIYGEVGIYKIVDISNLKLDNLPGFLFELSCYDHSVIINTDEYNHYIHHSGNMNSHYNVLDDYKVVKKNSRADIHKTLLKFNMLGIKCKKHIFVIQNQSEGIEN